jgi:heme oxygenase
MTTEIHRRLREATRVEHQRLEARADIIGRIAGGPSRRALLRRFHQLHGEIEGASRPWLANLEGLDFDARLRTRFLEHDMAVLGMTWPTAATAMAVKADSVGEALGLMYVLEGSTLGGRIIHREAARGGGDLAGLSFLDPYGEEVGERWRSFLAVVDKVGRSPAEADALVAGAVTGFGVAEHHLCAESADV